MRSRSCSVASPQPKWRAQTRCRRRHRQRAVAVGTQQVQQPRVQPGTVGPALAVEDVEHVAIQRHAEAQAGLGGGDACGAQFGEEFVRARRGLDAGGGEALQQGGDDAALIFDGEVESELAMTVRAGETMAVPRRQHVEIAGEGRAP